MGIDVLAIGAHPDDIELIVGGTLAKLADTGYGVVGIDMTRGEMGSRGSPEIRIEEAGKAGQILGLTDRINLDLGDNCIKNNSETRIRLVEIIRSLRPTIVMTHHWNDLHPDHAATAEIIKDIMYPVGFHNYPAKDEPFRPNEVLFFMGHFPFEPNLIVDVSDYFENKIKAIKCYESQLFNPEIQDKPTNIAQPEFLKIIEARARHYGSLIQTRFGEPFAVRRPIPVIDPVEMYRPFKKI